MSETKVPEIVERTSSLPFEDTVKRLVSAIEKGGMTIFAEINHAANARDVGLTMPPTTVLIYGSPKGGTPIMFNTPLAALDLPLRVLVREGADGKTVIAFHPVAALLRRSGVPQDAALRLEPAQLMLLAAVTP